MDEQVLKDLRSFDAVWNRVTAASQGERAAETASARPFDEAETLAALIGDELRDSRFYAALARGAGSLAPDLLCLSAAEREHLRALSAEYYLLTGRRCRPGGTCPVARSVLPGLRLAHENEVEGAAAYAAAAEETGSARLGALYRALAADEEAHAAKLRALIGRAL